MVHKLFGRYHRSVGVCMGDKMKKTLVYTLIMLLVLLCTGCNNKINGKETKEEIPKKESVSESNKQEDTTKKEADTADNQNKEQEETKTEIPIEETTPPIVTDEAVILGMRDEIINNMTTEEKVGQLFIVNLETLDKSQGSYYEFKDVTNDMITKIKQYNIGGVCLFARNIEQREQTINLNQNLQEVSKIPMFITVDEEGGEVSRIASNDNMQTTKFSSMEEVGNFDDEEYSYNVGSTIGREIKELGFNVDFAPVADVKTNEYNTEIGSRSFGSDAKLVGRMVAQVVKGLQDQGISATLKHFPGHGDAAEDSHEGAVNVENDIDRLRKVEFVPFKAGIKASADFVMVSHISISRITQNTVPASLSSLVLDKMLRIELGFEGIIITDAMDMKSITSHYSSKQAALKSFKSGADIILMPENLEEAYNAILQAVKKGTITEERLNESVTRIIETKIRRGIITADTKLVSANQPVK